MSSAGPVDPGTGRTAAGTADRIGRLASLQPLTVARWLASTDAVDGDGPFRVVDGTVVSADISGFTRLAERLADQGVRGAAEALIGTINRCFVPMVDDIVDRGGDVLKFGGDAVFALFIGADHQRRAAAAAAAMQRDLVAVDLGVDLTLSMTVGIASGPVELILAGTARRELIVHGTVVDQCLRLESDAEPGEILIADATAAALPSAWITEPEPEVLALVPDVDEAPPPQRAGDDGAPEAVRHRLSEERWSEALGQNLAAAIDAFDETSGEIRVVTVGFVHLPTAALDDATVAAVVERAIERCGRYGATMLSTDVAPGGLKILLAAGAPTAGEGDEDAMLATLTDLVLAPDAPPMRAGVNRGLVFAGFLGSPRCRTFTVMGDPTNLAARLLG
ncbi:MAG: adenylate/guanylate cyclase domain-containing protein, partial [Actinomycetota bacterium]